MSEYDFLKHTGLSEESFELLMQARVLIERVNMQLEEANSPLRYAVLSSTDPGRVKP